MREHWCGLCLGKKKKTPQTYQSVYTAKIAFCRPQYMAALISFLEDLNNAGSSSRGPGSGEEIHWDTNIIEVKSVTRFTNAEAEQKS